MSINPVQGTPTGWDSIRDDDKEPPKLERKQALSPQRLKEVFAPPLHWDPLSVLEACNRHYETLNNAEKKS